MLAFNNTDYIANATTNQITKSFSGLFFGDMMLDRYVGKIIKSKGLDYLLEEIAGEEEKNFFGNGYNFCKS